MPDFDQYVEYKTEQGIFPVPPDAHTLDALPTLEAVRDGYANALALGRTPTLPVESFRQAAADVYHEDVLEAEVSADPVQTFDRLAWVRSRPEWRVDATFAAEEVVLYPVDNNLYQTVIAHTVQAANWTPELRTLYRRYYHLDEVPEWTQPISSVDAWQKTNRVKHVGYYWTSLIDNNVWEPGVQGSEALWERGGVILPDGSEGEQEEPGVKEWVSGEQGLQVGDLRSWQGVVYRVRQNPGANIWQPPIVPALWTPV